MKNSLKVQLTAFFASALLFGNNVYAVNQLDLSETADPNAATVKEQQPAPVNPDLEASSKATLAWLTLVDKGQYGESWDKGAKLFQMTMGKDEWQKVMDTVRKPLGSVGSRTVLDQRTASNPAGLPPGDYMVLFYNTSFQNRPSAYELVTLMKEDGQWHVLTYQVQ